MDDRIGELDVVALTCDMPQAGLVKGQVGTVVADYSPDYAEVEFVDPQGHTYGLLTLHKKALLLLQYQPVKAA